jgi:branched-chain amino acid transport system ATP-binding protein
MSEASDHTPALEVRGISVRFGGTHAVNDVSLAAARGSVTGIIGPNGAGKTTLFNVICGLQNANSGRVLLNGTDVTKLRPYKRARLGLARTFQRLELFGLLSARANIHVAAGIHRSHSGRSRDLDEVTDGLIERLGLTAVADKRSDELPTGQARLVEVGRALATEPTVLLLDEPASGQDASETEAFGALLRDLAHDGIAVVLVEHDVRLVMEVCDLVHVLDFGLCIASGTPDVVRNDPAVQAAYLGAPDQVA